MLRCGVSLRGVSLPVEVAPTATVCGAFAFMQPSTVRPDSERRGLLRAGSQPLTRVPDPDRYDLRATDVVDLTTRRDLVPSLEREGFAQVHVGDDPRLRAVLQRVRARGHLDRDAERAIRRTLLGRVLTTGDHGRLRIIHIAGEGFIMRRQGPNGSGAAKATSDKVHHDAARIVHIDQDVDGTPVRQILRGAAPWLFRHRSPLSANRRAPLHLLNLWIPLDQVVAPLALLDGGTLDRARHQLRYGLSTDAILDRDDEGRRVNDIWTLLHHPDQRWYFTSELEMGRGYVFETLSTAHSAFVLPGEDRAERLLVELARLEQSLRPPGRVELNGILAGLRGTLEADTSAPRTRPLMNAIETGFDLMDEACSVVSTGDIPATWLEGWRARLEVLRHRLTRKSLEMRLVAIDH